MTDTIDAPTQPAYAPRADLLTKVRRRMARHVSRRPVHPALSRGLVSFSFDDCPRSVVEDALPRLEAQGWQATIYASMGLCGTTNHLGLHMSEADMVAAHERGHEIGDHTFSHLDGLQEGAEAVLCDIAANRAAFDRLGLPRARTFAYPYGEVTMSLKRALSEEFGLLRGIHSPYGSEIDLGLAASARLYSCEMDATEALIREASKEKRWLILFGHDVREDPSDYGCTPGELQRIIDLVASLDLDVATVRGGLDRVTA
ncbi:MAG: polysaccharide deacetylase family protein [Litorimonas sp.]